MTGPAPSTGGSPGGSGHIRDRHTDHADENLRTMPPNRLTLAPCFAHRGPGHRPWVTDARSPAPRAPPPACPRFSPAESAPHMSHVTNSLCGGEFLRVSRGTGPQGAAPASVQGTRSDPHSPGVHTAGCATGTGPIACAVASPAAMTRELRADELEYGGLIEHGYN